MQLSSKINVSCYGQCYYYAIGPHFITNLTANSSLLQTTSQPFVSAYCCFAEALFNHALINSFNVFSDVSARQ